MKKITENDEIIVEDADYKVKKSRKIKFDLNSILSTRNAIILIIVIGLLTMIGMNFLGNNSNSDESKPDISDKVDKEDDNDKDDNASVESVVNPNADELRNVLYYGDWSVWGGQGNFYPKDIAADKITHLNYAFIDFDANGNLVWTDADAAISNPVGEPGAQWGSGASGIISAFRSLKAENKNLRTGISVGGWSKSGDFALVCDDDTKRETLVNNLVDFVIYADMDFVDIDWEYPGFVREADKVDNQNDEGSINASEKDKENYIKFLKELRNALDVAGKENGKYYEISIAIPANLEKLEAGIDVDKVFEIIDFANVMTYDMRGGFDAYSGHQSALYGDENDPLYDKGYNIDTIVNYLIDEGAPSKKIVIGSAFYTRGWEKVGSDDNGLYQEAEKVNKDADQNPSYGAINEAPLVSGDGGRVGGVYAYRSIDKIKSKYSGIKEYWDDVAKAPYLYDSKTGAFFTYDNERSIQEKANYVNENDLGGIISWMASNDAPTTSGDSERGYLITAQYNALFNDTKLKENEIKSAPLDIKTKVSSNTKDGKKAITITIMNNEKVDSNDKVISDLQNSYFTIKNPKLIIEVDNMTSTGGDYTAGNVKTEGNKILVDLSSVYDAKAIKPNANYTFTIYVDGTAENINNITLQQYINPEGSYISEQEIYKK